MCARQCPYVSKYAKKCKFLQQINNVHQKEQETIHVIRFSETTFIYLSGPIITKKSIQLYQKSQIIKKSL